MTKMTGGQLAGPADVTPADRDTHRFLDLASYGLACRLVQRVAPQSHPADDTRAPNEEAARWAGPFGRMNLG